MANIIKIKNGLEVEPSFYNINDFIHDIHYSRKIPNNFYKFPNCRIIKSHSGRNPYYKKVVYLYRKPYDVLKSYYKMMIGLNKFKGSFTQFVNDKNLGIDAWIKHFQGWLIESSIYNRFYLINYNLILQNPFEEILRLVNVLGWNVSQKIIKNAINKSSLEEMIEIENLYLKSDIRFQLVAMKDYRFVGNKNLKIDKNELIEGKEIIQSKIRVLNKKIENLIV